MKRIYLLVTLVFAMGASAFAQTTDMQIDIQNLPDTIKWNNKGTYGYVISWKFTNNGPTALVHTTDTIMFKRPNGNNVRLSLPAPSGSNPGGCPVGSSVYFNNDTIALSTVSVSSPYSWCDSIWTRRSGAVMVDPTITNNKICKNVWFKQIDPVAVANVAANANGVTIYPNPASSTVNVKYNFAANTNARIVVKDMMGKTVLSNNFGTVSGEQDFKVTISNLAAGVYVMELYANDDKMVSKFSVEK